MACEEERRSVPDQVLVRDSNAHLLDLGRLDLEAVADLGDDFHDPARRKSASGRLVDGVVELTVPSI